MGNFWTGVDNEKLKESEYKLLQINGIPRDAFTIKNVSLDGNPESENYIHEIYVKGVREGLPKLVCIHGYLSGSIQFSKMMRYLRQYFEVHAICLLGMGSSGRPVDNDFQGFDDTMGYFIDSIQRYVKI